MNFATLKGLTIPEGNVTQITDAGGRVIWKQAPKEVTITITELSAYYYTPARHLWLEINGITYDTQSSILSATEIPVPVGTVIKCCFSGAYTSNKIYLNETVIAEGMETYDYTVTGDISIKGSLKVTGGGMGSPGSVSERYFEITEQ